MKDLRQFIKTTIREFLNEDIKTNAETRLNFTKRADFSKAVGILLSKGYNRSTTIDKGKGYFSTDEHWFTISFNRNLEDDILPYLHGINYEIEHKKPIDYKIFNQGGYLD